MKDVLRTTRSRFAPIFASLAFLGAVLVPHALAQEAADTASAETGFGTGENFLLLDLIGEANGFQYPIFGLLAIGLFLISAKVYELYKDRQAAEELEEASLEEMEMKRIAMLVANQKESMLAELQATMLNVFQTTEDAATLHEEIANYVQFQRDRFETFKLRIDFLADTAGAVGLLGTVWGILTVFTGGGIDDEQRVLAGMGVALVSTLLGLVVSITLNLISTEVHSFFDNRLDQIEDKADELRFRLLELGFEDTNGSQEAVESEETVSDQVRGPTSPTSSVQDGQERSHATKETGDSVRASGGSMREESRKTEPATSAADTASAADTVPVSETVPPPEPDPQHLNVVEEPKNGTVATTLSDISLEVKDENGEPLAEERVYVEIGDNAGELDGRKTELTRHTNQNGILSFDWHLPERAGRYEAHATVPSSEAPDTSCELSVLARPGSPDQYRQDGNNQGAEVGGTLPNPLVLRLLDEYQNPVSGHIVRFEVDSGEGTFENGEKSIELQTDENGVAGVRFSVGDSPGLNTILARAGNEEFYFQAMALEQ